MHRNQRVLVALSRTEDDRQLIQYARMLAKIGMGRHFQFVHVRTPGQVADDDAPVRQVVRECEAVVAELFGEPREDVHVTCHVLTGVRVDQLIEFSTLNRSDLILMGHRRARTGQRSLARRLAMISPCSVWMVPEGSPLSIRSVIAPIDFSDHSADSPETAVSLARAAGLEECLAVHVFFDPSAIRYDEHRDEIRQNEQASFRKFLAPIDLKGLRVEPVFAEGNNVAKTLLHVARQHECDLLVMSTRGRSRAASILLGSVTNQVMIESSVAILAVKHFGAMMHLFQALQQGHFWDRSNPKTN